jgi:hypothetical protein
MPTSQDAPRRSEPAPGGGASGEAGLLEAVVRDSVIHGLGRPDDLLRVQVTPVGSGRFRVNVFVGGHTASARVAHSYYVQADGNGKILESSPAVERLY